MKTKTTKKTTKKQAEREGATPAKKKTPKAERDPLGSREGSMANKINLALLHSRKPHTVPELAEISGVHNGRVRSHLKWLEHYGAAAAGEDGAWTLKSRKQVFGLKAE